MKISNWLSFPALLLACLIQPTLVFGVTVGQIDTFENGTTDNWLIYLHGMGAPPPAALPVNIATGGPGGANDNYMQLTAVGGEGNKAVAQKTTTDDSVAKQLKRIEDFRDNFATSMKEAAKRAKVELLAGDIAVSVRGGYVIANALIAPPKDVPIEQADKMFFVYLSLPANHAFARKVPSGFYTIERVPNQKNPRAKVVNLEGETVLELPLNIRKIEMSPPKWDTPPKEQVTVAQAMIEQSQATLYQDLVIQAHGVICYPRAGVWYWTWIVIILV